MRLLILFAALMAASSVLANERVVTDDTGRTITIPIPPQRIVVMHEPLLGLPLIDLGIQPVGSYGRSDDGSFVTRLDFIDSVFGEGLPKPKGIGAFGQVDLEKLHALEPDLIISTELDAGKADQLSTVAPVYLQNVSTDKVYGFGVQEQLAMLVGYKNAFEERLTSYRKRTEEVKALLPFDPAGKTFLAVFLTDQINVVGDATGLTQALEDLGLARLKLETEGRRPGQSGSMLLVPLSAEAFGRLQPDLLVLMNSYMASSRGEVGTREALDRILPGWERFVKPAREGQVLFADPAKVISPTVASAEHALDAFEHWLAQEE